MTTTTDTHPFNAVNRGVYVADNLDFLRTLNDECVDLVCIDPPFDKNETFPADRLLPPLTDAERDNELRLLARWGITTPEQAADKGLEWPPDNAVRGGYKDIWRWEQDIHQEWLDTIEAAYPAIHALIESTRLTHSSGRAAYLCFMAIRLLELHRVLKPDGSLYLHCDSTANAYLRLLLDVVFGDGEDGRPGFRNEITWHRTRGRTTGRHWGNVTETILFYSKSSTYLWNDTYLPPANARDTTGDLTGAGISGSESGRPWRGINPGSVGRHWSVPRRGNFARWVEDNHIPGYTGIADMHQRLDALDSAGLIRWSGAGRPALLRPADSAMGAKVNSLWADINRAGTIERAGYPTQKPVALAERIIAASTNPGAVVLDCFAGCAYVGVAAERLGRRWAACDFNPRAWTVFKRQFNKPQLALLCCNDATTGQQVLASEPTVTIHGPDELPVRTSPERAITLQPFTTPERRFKKSALMTESEMLNELLTLSDYQAWCCGFANRRDDGSVVRRDWNFHLDHIDPKAAGGINEIINRAPMCPHHNIRKSNRLVALREYRNQIADAGEMMVASAADLIDLGWAQSQVLEIHARYYIQRRPQEAAGLGIRQS